MNNTVYELILLSGQIVRMTLTKGMTLKYALEEKNIKIRGYKVVK